MSLACTLLAAGRRAQGAGGEGEVFAERVDEVCLHKLEEELKEVKSEKELWPACQLSCSCSVAGCP